MQIRIGIGARGDLGIPPLEIPLWKGLVTTVTVANSNRKIMEMTVKYVLSLCILTSLMPMTSVSLAQSVAQSGLDTPGYLGFQGDQKTLIHSIHSIERSTGGKVVDIRYAQADGMPGFHAVVVKPVRRNS
jgi:hypothetical protein